MAKSLDKPASPMEHILRVWGAQKTLDGYPKTEPRGQRDLMWCPYLNEPAIIHWGKDEPYCPNCNGNFEPETHTFLMNIKKPNG